jgi:hypothetical protein
MLRRSKRSKNKAVAAKEEEEEEEEAPPSPCFFLLPEAKNAPSTFPPRGHFFFSYPNLSAHCRKYFGLIKI